VPHAVLLVTGPTYRSRCIVVGYDGTDPSRSAVAYAARRVGKAGKVVVVHVPRSPAPPSETMRGKVLDALLIQLGDVLRDTDFDLEIVAGRPATAIASIAKERNADEIAVGARGARPGQPLRTAFPASCAKLPIVRWSSSRSRRPDGSWPYDRNGRGHG